MERFVALIGFTLLGAACGLNVVGTTDLDGGSSDAATEPETFVPGPRSCPGGEAGCAARLPSGWQAVIYSSTGGLCPSNFAAREYLVDPKPEPGACKCTCVPSAVDPPSCAKGRIAIEGGDNFANCFVGSSSSYEGVTGLCQPHPVAKPNVYATYQPPGFTPGACVTAAEKNDPTAFTSTVARACVPSTACLDEVCSGVAPEGFKACIFSDGDQECPAGPFTERTIVGDATDLTCSGCAGCENAGACSTGALRFFSDTECKNASGSRTVDNNCQNAGTGTPRSFRYEALPPTSVTCKATGTPVATFALAQVHTVCCR